MSSRVPTIPVFGPGDSIIESLGRVPTSNEMNASSLQGEYVMVKDVRIKDVSSDTFSVTAFA